MLKRHPLPKSVLDESALAGMCGGDEEL